MPAPWTIQLVDSIATSPTVRLNLNDAVTWFCELFEAPPPRLRRSVSENAMRDGVAVSSSNYDARGLTLSLKCITSTQDLGATEVQKLARELDRPDNVLMYQPTGATKPVFFRLYRSDMSQLSDLLGSTQEVVREFTVELLAEPFALGLRETVAVGVVTNNPAAASRGCFFDVTGVIGDVAAPMMLLETVFTHSSMILAARQHGTPSDLTFFKQCESMTLGTDTTNPGGGPDAAMSGTGTNNYARTSFASGTTMTDRLTWNIGTDHSTTAKKLALAGSYRIKAVVRRSDATSVMTAKVVSSGGTHTGETTTIPLTTNRQVVDLGILSYDKFGRTAGYGPVLGVDAVDNLIFQAARASGAGTLDWDAIVLVPADEMVHINSAAVLAAPVDGYLVDSANENVLPSVGDPFSTGTTGWRPPVLVSGGWPALVPNQTNRFIVLLDATVFTTASGVTKAVTVAVSYWPRYLFVRPSAT